MSGLTKASLMLSSTGKVVSKKQNAQGKKAYKRIAAWTKAGHLASHVEQIVAYADSSDTDASRTIWTASMQKF